MKISADDYGLNKKENEDIIKKFQYGIINNICLMPSGSYFDDAISGINEINGVNIDIHLNISEGKPVIAKNNNILINKEGNFKIGFIRALIMSCNKKFLNEVYDEYKAQIEMVISKGIIPNSLNSHIHLHAIPNIFRIVCKLAKEYNIKSVRTHYEKFYFVNDIKLIFNIKFIINIVKNLILKIFTFINLKTLNDYGLSTNKFLVGILYTSMMSNDAIKKGIEVCNNEDNIEVILHFIPENLEYNMLFS